MANEPELSAGADGEWVLYLQQTLNHHYQQTVIAESGEFDTALESVVQHFQRQQGLTPDGVVTQATWAALTGDGVPTQSTGADAERPPASLADGGAPALKYNWPDIPVASAMVDTGNAVVELELTLTGESTVAFPRGLSGAAVDQDGLNLAAGQALDGLTTQISVSDLDSGTPGISAAAGIEFTPLSASPLTPDRIEFGGDCQLDYEVPTGRGEAKVTGRPGFTLRVTVTPHDRPDEEPVVDGAPSWFAHHADDLVTAGQVVLVAAFAIALAPETGGASLVLLGAG